MKAERREDLHCEIRVSFRTEPPTFFVRVLAEESPLRRGEFVEIGTAEFLTFSLATKAAELVHHCARRTWEE